MNTQRCNMGVGCEEYGVCYAEAHNCPELCGRPDILEKKSVINRFFIKELAIIIIGTAVLALWYLTAPSQVFDDCGGPDVPAHCVE